MSAKGNKRKSSVSPRYSKWRRSLEIVGYCDDDDKEEAE